MFQWFQLIDLVSYMSSKSLNSFDLSQITLAFRPLAGSLVSMMASKPRHWLVIRKKMRSLREKNVSFIYGTIQQALRRIDELVIITYKRGGFPKMILQCILARRLVLEAIEREIYALASTIRRSGGRIGIPELIQSYQRPRQKLSYVRHGNTNALFSILKHLYMLLLESLASDPRHLVAAGKLSRTQFFQARYLTDRRACPNPLYMQCLSSFTANITDHTIFERVVQGFWQREIMALHCLRTRSIEFAAEKIWYMEAWFHALGWHHR